LGWFAHVGRHAVRKGLVYLHCTFAELPSRSISIKLRAGRIKGGPFSIEFFSGVEDAQGQGRAVMDGHGDGAVRAVTGLGRGNDAAR
jgi:hypothetical protein